MGWRSGRDSGRDRSNARSDAGRIAAQAGYVAEYRATLLLRPAGVEALAQKKSLERRRAVTARRDRATTRRGAFAQAGLRAERLVFIDETWVKTNMTRPRGRSPSGTRLLYAVPHGHWKTTTFLAGLRTRGLVAPLVVDGAINGELFRGYVQQHLADLDVRATSSSSTISIRIKSPVCVPRSKQSGPNSGTCHRIVQISIPSSKSSQSSSG